MSNHYIEKHMWLVNSKHALFFEEVLKPHVVLCCDTLVSMHAGNTNTKNAKK